MRMETVSHLHQLPQTIMISLSQMIPVHVTYIEPEEFLAYRPQIHGRLHKLEIVGHLLNLDGLDKWPRILVLGELLDERFTSVHVFFGPSTTRT